MSAATATLLAPPPVAAAQPAGEPATAGMPSEFGQPRSGTTRFQMPFLETLMGAVLTLGLLAGLIAGGLYLWHNATGGTAPMVEAKADDLPPAPDANKEIVPAPENPGLPKALVGTWEARTDSIASVVLDLAPNGIALYTTSPDGTLAIPSRGFWIEKGHRGDEHIIDFVPAANTQATHRFTLTLTGPDAFTQSRVVTNREANRDEVRFVRRQPKN